MRLPTWPEVLLPTGPGGRTSGYPRPLDSLCSLLPGHRAALPLHVPSNGCVSREEAMLCQAVLWLRNQNSVQ